MSVEAGEGHSFSWVAPFGEISVRFGVQARPDRWVTQAFAVISKMVVGVLFVEGRLVISKMAEGCVAELPSS
jgi:hypothetical protein